MDQRFFDLLDTKKFDDLSSEDKEYILKYCSKEDFEAMGQVTVGCQAYFNRGFDQIEPKIGIHDNLMDAYCQKFITKPDKNWNVLGIEMQSWYGTSVFRYGVLGGLLLLMSLSLGALLLDDKSSNKGKGENVTTEMYIGQIEDFEKMNKNLYFKDEGVNVGIIMPETMGRP